MAHTLDLLVDSDLQICAEVFLDIHHNLLSRTGRADDIEKIVSHPQALAQCRRWLASHFPQGRGGGGGEHRARGDDGGNGRQAGRHI